MIEMLAEIRSILERTSLGGIIKRSTRIFIFEPKEPRPDPSGFYCRFANRVLTRSRNDSGMSILMAQIVDFVGS